MRIRALPISEWSTGEVCGHVCKRGSRDRRVSGICVVSTLAVCMRSSRVGLSACVSFLPLELGFGRRVFPFHFFLVVTVLLLFLCFVSVGDMGRHPATSLWKAAKATCVERRARDPHPGTATGRGAGSRGIWGGAGAPGGTVRRAVRKRGPALLVSISTDFPI